MGRFPTGNMIRHFKGFNLPLKDFLKIKDIEKSYIDFFYMWTQDILSRSAEKSMIWKL